MHICIKITYTYTCIYTHIWNISYVYMCSTRINVNTCSKNAIGPTVIRANVYEMSVEQTQNTILKRNEYCAEDYGKHEHLISEYTHVNRYMFVRIHLGLYMYIWIYINIHTKRKITIYIYMFEYVDIISIYIYIYIYIYVYICIY